MLEKERLLLAGDGLNPTLLLLGGEAAPIGQLRQTLEAAEQLPFDPGIFPAIPRGRCRKSRWDSICATWTACARSHHPTLALMGRGSAGVSTRRLADGLSFSLTGAWWRIPLNKTEKSSRTLLGSGAFLRGSLCTQSCFESSLNCQIVFANNQRGVPALGQDLGLFHLGGIGRAVLLEELQPLIHMSSGGRTRRRPRQRGLLPR